MWRVPAEAWEQIATGAMIAPLDLEVEVAPWVAMSQAPPERSPELLAHCLANPAAGSPLLPDTPGHD